MAINHPSAYVQRAMTELLDALCSWERSTGRESLLVLIPVEHDEEIVVADSGKLVQLRFLDYELIGDRVQLALEAHDNWDKHHFID